MSSLIFFVLSLQLSLSISNIDLWLKQNRQHRKELLSHPQRLVSRSCDRHKAHTWFDYKIMIYHQNKWKNVCTIKTIPQRYRRWRMVSPMPLKVFGQTYYWPGFDYIIYRVPN